MPTTLQVTENLSVTPLIDMQDAAFAKGYGKGLLWSLYGDYQGVKPLSDLYLVDNLKRDISNGFFDSQHDGSVDHLAVYFGMIRGGLLSPHTGQLRSNVTTLVTLSHPYVARGYSVGRRDRLYYAQPEPYSDTDKTILEELRAIAQDLRDHPDDGTSWYYSVGCIVGNLSVTLFPATTQE
jgi:hypothetical protein